MTLHAIFDPEHVLRWGFLEFEREQIDIRHTDSIYVKESVDLGG